MDTRPDGSTCSEAPTMTPVRLAQLVPRYERKERRGTRDGECGRQDGCAANASVAGSNASAWASC